MTQLPWNPTGVLSRLVESGLVDLGPPTFWLLHAERLNDPPDAVRGYTLQLWDWENQGIHEGRPWMPYWQNLQSILTIALRCPSSELVWWAKPVYDPDYQPPVRTDP